MCCISIVPILLTVVCVIKANISENKEMAKALPKTMRAVGLYEYLPISDPKSLVDLTVDLPALEKHDVLVEVKAAAVNPIDTKQRAPKPGILKSPRILGWDGAGVIVNKGENVKTFNIGDNVFFTGDIRRNGSNAQYVAVNEIMVGPKPKNLKFEEAAAMPLTSLTAYEALYDRLLLLSQKDKGKSLLIINSAGGVGSVASQLAKNMGLKVIGTASREESQNFTRKFGSDIVLNHKLDLKEQLRENNIKEVDYIMVNYDPFPYWNTLMEIIKPQGKICLIVDCSQPVDIRPLKDKSVTLVSEMMATRFKYDTEDKFRQHEILRTVSKMLEIGTLKTTLSKTKSPFNALTLKEAHKMLEDQSLVGKLVITGFRDNLFL